MKLLLPLLFLCINCIGQDTTYMSSGYNKVTNIFSFQDILKSRKEENVTGALTPFKRIGNLLYLGLIKDTLIITAENKVAPELRDSLMDTYQFNKGVGFYEYGLEQSNGSITDHLFIYYNDISIPENTPPQYFDRKTVSYLIAIVRKPPKYSN